MDKQEKRKPIRKKIRYLLLRISIFSMFAICVAALAVMFRIRNHSEKYILEAVESNVMSSLDDITTMTDIQLQGYIETINQSSDYINQIYDNPQNFVLRDLPEHMHLINGDYCFRIFYINEEYKKNIPIEELQLVNNIESFWTAIFSNDDGNITSLYLGTESGFFLSYDKEHIYDTTNAEG